MARAVVVTRIVCPSGAAFATKLAAVLPPAPARFSTVTGWPHLSCSFWPTERARVSAKPPAAKPTIRLMRLEGYCAAPWAWAAAVPAISRESAARPLRATGRAEIGIRSSTQSMRRAAAQRSPSSRSWRRHLWGTGKLVAVKRSFAEGPRIIRDPHAFHLEDAVRLRRALRTSSVETEPARPRPCPWMLLLRKHRFPRSTRSVGRSGRRRRTRTGRRAAVASRGRRNRY